MVMCLPVLALVEKVFENKRSAESSPATRSGMPSFKRDIDIKKFIK
jgi:hypothetical protein